MELSWTKGADIQMRITPALSSQLSTMTFIATVLVVMCHCDDVMASNDGIVRYLGGVFTASNNLEADISISEQVAWSKLGSLLFHADFCCGLRWNCDYGSNEDVITKDSCLADRRSRVMKEEHRT